MAEKTREASPRAKLRRGQDARAGDGSEVVVEAARVLSGLPAESVRTHLASHPPADPGALLAAFRDEASRYYHADAAQARRIAARAVEVAQLLGDPHALGWAERTMAEALLFSGRMREADRAYARAADAWKRSKASALLGQLEVGHIHVLALLGRMQDVTRVARRARKLLEAAGDRVYLAKLAMNLGNIHFQRDEYAAASAEYERARGLFRRLGVHDQTVVALEVNRAVALTQLDRDEEALALFRRLDRACARRGFELLRAQVWMNAGYVHMLRGDFDLALADIQRAADYFARTEHPAFLGTCRINQAEIYEQLNLHDESLRLAQEAASLFEADGLRYDQALALAQGGLGLLGMGDGAGAAVLIRKALGLFRKEKNPARVAYMILLWAEADARRGRRAGARKRAREARLAFRRLGLVRWEALAAAVWIRVADRATPLTAQRRLLRDLLARLPKSIYPLQSMALLELLGSVELRAGSAAAGRTFARAAAQLESVRVRVPTEDTKIAFLRGRTHPYDELLQLELARPRPNLERVFGWMERSRSQGLWDRIRQPQRWGVVGSGDPGQDERRRLSWLHARVSRLELGGEEDRARAGALRRELAAAEQAWARRLREGGEASARAAASSRRTAGARPARLVGAAEVVDPRALVRALPPGHGFVSFHLAPGFACAVVLTKERRLRVGLADDLSARVGRLVDRLDFQWNAAAVASAHRTRSSPTPIGADRLLSSATDAILTELHEVLWRPLEEAGLPEMSGVVVSPHGPIHRVPLHALRSPGGYLAERLSIRLAPSARIWMRRVGRRRSTPRRAYLGAVPTPELPEVAAEIERVRAKLHGWTVHMDEAPTRETLKKEAAQAGILHLATHGVLRSDNPAFSYVQLADGPLYVHDLAELRLPGSTVVLTACSSGRGAAPAGDEWVGLARGFLQAGAKTIVASLWPVQDEATRVLMERFYERLAAGGSPEVALQGAMQALLPAWTHPWQWAPFAVLGAR